jgi:hypothetical protein
MMQYPEQQSAECVQRSPVSWQNDPVLSHFPFVGLQYFEQQSVSVVHGFPVDLQLHVPPSTPHSEGHLPSEPQANVLQHGAPPALHALPSGTHVLPEHVPVVAPVGTTQSRLQQSVLLKQPPPDFIQLESPGPLSGGASVTTPSVLPSVVPSVFESSVPSVFVSPPPPPVSTPPSPPVHPGFVDGSHAHVGSVVGSHC